MLRNIIEKTKPMHNIGFLGPLGTVESRTLKQECDSRQEETLLMFLRRQIG